MRPQMDVRAGAIPGVGRLFPPRPGLLRPEQRHTRPGLVVTAERRGRFASRGSVAQSVPGGKATVHSLEAHRSSQKHMSETHHRQAQAKAVVDDSLGAAMLELAAQMRAGAEELAERMTDTVYREIPEYRIAWPHLRE